MDRARNFAAQLKTWCLDDWEAKLVALVLACIVWYVVKGRIEKDAAEKKFTVPTGFEMKRTESVSPRP